MHGIGGFIPCGSTVPVTCSVYATEPPGRLEIRTTLGDPMPCDQMIQNHNNGTITVTIKKEIEYVLCNSIHFVMSYYLCTQIAKNCDFHFNKY